MREIREEVRFGPSTGSLVEEAESRDIPFIRLNDQSLVQLGYGVHQKRIQATTTANTNMIAVDIAGNKHATKKLLGDMGVPVPKGYRIRDEDELENVIGKIGYPIVIKPLDGNHGKGATVGIKTIEDARIAFEKAKEYSRWVIVEKMLVGEDFRALVVNNRLIAVAERTPAHVIGDGKSTIQQLIDKTNADPRRGYGHENVLTQIDIDEQTTAVRQEKGYTLESVLPKDEILHLKTTANISTGGTAIDRTDEVHPENVFLFERIARIIGLDVAGIDIIAPNVSRTLARERRRDNRGKCRAGFPDAPLAARGHRPKRRRARHRYAFSARRAVAHPDHRRHRHQRENDHHAPDRAYPEKQRADGRLYDDRRNIYPEPADRDRR